MVGGDYFYQIVVVLDSGLDGLSFSLVWGFRSVLKGKGRSVIALMGALLAVTLIEGANVSVDIAARGLLLVAMDKVPIDPAWNSNWQELMGEVN